MKITELQPKSVFRFFSEISEIPHGSGNTEALRDYCVSFAESRNLKYICDDAGNIIIYKNGSEGYENSETVIIQGHLDMVCEKEKNCSKNMETEGITICCDDEFIFADRTTLGADDGIAVAYALALLDDDSIPHPPLEILFTADEEIGLLGANALDFTLLKGKKLINIDSEEEGILIAGCAGGERCCCTIETDKERVSDDYTFHKISVHGLRGGHSGIDIGKNRANGIVLLAEMLEKISAECDIRVCSIDGGTKDNVIPKSAGSIIAVPENASIQNIIQKISNNINNKLYNEQAVFTIEKTEEKYEVLSRESAKKLLFVIMHSPDGVIEMMPDMPGMVMTSLNMGTVVSENDKAVISYMLRGNSSSVLDSLKSKMYSFMKYFDIKVEFSASYLPWEYREFSPLRNVMCSTFHEVYGHEPVIETIHAGLECAVFAGGIENADMVSFGPDIENAHTPDERIRISSVKNCWNYLLRLLEKLK